MNISIIKSMQFFMVIVFSVGACIGSFLNVCIYRIPRNKSIVFPRSFCPSCNNSIPFYFNIPILSYLILKGRCRYCKSKISLRYPFVEALTGCAAMGVVAKFGLTFESVFWFSFISILIIISFIDADFQIIPDIISIPGIILFSSSFVFIPEMSFGDTIKGIIAGGGSLYLVAIIYYYIRKQEGMGGGDIKLLAMIGAATGWQGVLFTIFFGSLLGTIAGMIIMITGAGHKKLRIPFGPYLSAGAAIYVFWGSSIIQWYLNLSAFRV